MPIAVMVAAGSKESAKEAGADEKQRRVADGQKRRLRYELPLRGGRRVDVDATETADGHGPAQEAYRISERPLFRLRRPLFPDRLPTFLASLVSGETLRCIDDCKKMGRRSPYCDNGITGPSEERVIGRGRGRRGQGGGAGCICRQEEVQGRVRAD